jgi:serine phosphatase RsbU (regulator of sigma subunit)
MPYGKNHLTFDFVGISLTTPEKVRYKYRLSPLEDKWLNTTRNEAVYSHIPPGSYRFEVMAMNNDGYWNEEPESFSFTILPPWYQTWWFYTLCIVLIGTGVYTFIVVRTKALKRQKELLEEQVRLRTQELREEKEKVEEINKEVLEKNEIIEEKNKDITDSINYAQKIQEALLPAKARIEQTSLKDFFILYYPKDIVSGDFYWFRKTEKMNFIAAVDCTGHGVPGAFMSMIGHNLLNQIVSREELTHPSEILTRLNKNLKGAFAASDDSIQTNDGMDMGMIGFNDEGHIEYSGAQRPAWIVRGGTELEQIKGSSRPIGGIADLDWEYENHVIQVEPGDTIYISSDGFQDQFGGPKGKKFMTKRLKELLVEIQPLDMQAQFKKLDDSLKEWMEGYEQMDDILVIGLKF